MSQWIHRRILYAHLLYLKVLFAKWLSCFTASFIGSFRTLLEFICIVLFSFFYCLKVVSGAVSICVFFSYYVHHSGALGVSMLPDLKKLHGRVPNDTLLDLIEPGRVQIVGEMITLWTQDIDTCVHIL